MSKKLCFVIGPMRDIQRLHRLAREIVAPVAEPLGYQVETPDPPKSGNIMHQVIAKLDQADLVIADLTGNNPNVCYELGIRHSLGLAYVIVREQKAGRRRQRAPFDIAAYRYAELEFDDIAAAQQALRPIVEQADAALGSDQPASNPVTDYYQMPLTQISPAAGLVLGYYRNFVEPAISRLCDDSRGICLAEGDNRHAITGDARSKASIDLIIPCSLDQARHDCIGRTLVAPGLLKEAEFERKPEDKGARPFTLYAWPDAQETGRLVDIPTAMNPMELSIQRRLGQAKPIYNEAWRIMEGQEIVRFLGALKTELERLFNEKAHLRGRLRLVSWPPDWPKTRPS
jgi:hypothetical protein